MRAACARTEKKSADYEKSNKPLAGLGTVIVKTPIGLVDFYVVKADTPFLLCLADMDRLRVYYNNVIDTLIGPALTLPVIRRFGHLFMV
jgi:hypothetical protein